MGICHDCMYWRSKFSGINIGNDFNSWFIVECPWDPLSPGKNTACRLSGMSNQSLQTSWLYCGIWYDLENCAFIFNIQDIQLMTWWLRCNKTSEHVHRERGSERHSSVSSGNIQRTRDHIWHVCGSTKQHCYWILCGICYLSRYSNVSETLI